MRQDASAGQLEFFDVARTVAPRPRRPVGAWTLTVRHDQLMVAAIAGLLSVTVVFAGGVERGKRLARIQVRPVEVLAPVAAPVVAPKPAVAVPAKPKAAPVRVAQAGGAFAVQVVTYRQPQQATREMQRLQSGGERAFLVMTDGHTRVLLGPFDSKGDARAKLTEMKTRYRDCFVRTL
jgi:hypothetical protein